MTRRSLDGSIISCCVFGSLVLTALADPGAAAAQHGVMHDEASESAQQPLAPELARGAQFAGGPGARDAGVQPLPRTLPRCAGALRLSGSAVNANQPQRSIAALQVNGATRVARVGQRVGARTLIGLRPSRAFLREPDGSICEVPSYPSVNAPPPPPPAPKAEPAKAEASKKKKKATPAFSEEELKAGVRSVGADTYEVSRELLEKALGNPAALQRAGRFRVHNEGGRIMGLSLLRIRKNSPLPHLGLKKGDVIRRLNGHDLAAPDGAIQAYAAIKSTDGNGRFTLAIVREGAPKTITYIVR